MARIDRFGAEDAWPGARAFPARAADRLHAPLRRLPAVQARTPPTSTRIAAGQEPEYPGDRALERRIEAYIRWNALAMVVAGEQGVLRVRRPPRELRLLGDALRGRLQPFLARALASSTRATWCSSRGTPRPGIYARAYLEGRLSEEQLQHFRQEVERPGVGLSSYPHPWLMPDFWQFPTVSMGLGPMMAIFQARFMRYLEHRGLVTPSDRKVWAFLRRRRDGRARVDGRAHDAGAREARQPHLRHQLQPAAPRRPGARQRQDHPGARGGLPRRRLERHQGAVGLALGSAAGARPPAACCAA